MEIVQFLIDNNNNNGDDDGDDDGRFSRGVSTVAESIFVWQIELKKLG